LVIGHFETEEPGMADFNKVGALILRGDRILLCRKDRDTSKLIVPGGRIEPGESDAECLAREIREELGAVKLNHLKYLGTYEDRASLDDPTVVKTLRLVLYTGELEGAPTPSSEITELVWFGPDSNREELTPIFLNRILPDLLARGILPWRIR
jgi:8-oxo-dGTP pyrophosphatase MutT (NUDIX family)